MSKKMEWKKIYLTGKEIYTFYNVHNKKMLINNEDGNFIQRDFNEWDDPRKEEYKKSIIKNFPHNPIYIMDYASKWYVVDGQHRLQFIIEHIHSEFSKNIDDVIANNLFEIVLISFKGKEQEFIKEANEVFLNLNNTSDQVSRGSLFKSMLNRKNKKSFDSISSKLSKLYADVKAAKYFNKKDWIYELLGTTIFLMDTSKNNPEDLKKIKNLSKEAEHFLENGKYDDKIKILEATVDFLILNKIYSNANNSEKAAPNDHTFYATVLTIMNDSAITAADIPAKQFNSTINNNSVWKESKNNTRTPEAIYFKWQIMKKWKDNNDYGVIIKEVLDDK